MAELEPKFPQRVQHGSSLMEENRMKRSLATLCIAALMTTAAAAQNQPAKSTQQQRREQRWTK
jgi:hypothetical protein